MGDKIPNSKKYGPPEGYYEITKNEPPRPLLVDALKKINGSGKIALDFGCGSGRDTKYLLNKDFEVEATDGSSQAWDYLKKLPHQDKLNFIQSDFEAFKFKKYDFINAAYSLPFAHKKELPKIFNGLKKSLRPDGIFAGQFFGINDQWNVPGETISFLSREEVENLLRGLKVIKLEEKEYDGHIANGKPKHWHLFNIIAKKPSKEKIL